MRSQVTLTRSVSDGCKLNPSLTLRVSNPVLAKTSFQAARSINRDFLAIHRKLMRCLNKKSDLN